MNRFQALQDNFTDYLKKYYSLSDDLAQSINFILNTDPKKAHFGDISSNAALMLGKAQNRNPRELAQAIADNFTSDVVEKIEIAGPGFINFFLTPLFFELVAQDMLEQGNSFFKPHKLQKKNYSLEFVSANPTGPLHLGHGRGGIIGDVLANILKFNGQNVVKEFYINDAGGQIEKLGTSLKIRCQQQLGLDVQLPEDAYHGEYMVELAKLYLKEFGNDAINQPIEIYGTFAKERLLSHIKTALADYGIHFDVWFSETQLHQTGAVAKMVQKLIDNKLAYVHENAIWFKSTEFGDDKDRVLRRANGIYTYIAADIAYLENKLTRGFDKLIMILGQDHHSYLTRLKAVMQALGHNKEQLDVILYQLVTIKEGDQLLRMSKRAGILLTLKDIIEAVGKDVARFFYLNRKAEAHLDFDIDLALKKDDENPVYYIQYAYVRTNSIVRKASTHDELDSIKSNDIQHLELEDGDLGLIKKLISLKELLSTIAESYQTHLLSYYTLELAQEFHRYYGKYKVVDLDHIGRSRARLALIQLINKTLGLCLNLMSLETPEKM